MANTTEITMEEIAMAKTQLAELKEFYDPERINKFIKNSNPLKIYADIHYQNLRTKFYLENWFYSAIDDYSAWMMRETISLINSECAVMIYELAEKNNSSKIEECIKELKTGCKDLYKYICKICEKLA